MRKYIMSMDNVENNIFDRRYISAVSRHVLVDGVFVIRDGELDINVFPGKPVRRTVLRP